MQFSILTLFPEMFTSILDASILGRARKNGHLVTRLVQIRDFAEGKHRKTDDAPFGGGPGMVLKPDVLDRALEHVLNEAGGGWVIMLSPQGKKLDQADVRRLATMAHVVLVCGHYEGVDERLVQVRADEELSLGDFVLTGGELPAMVILDAVARLTPGVLGDEESAVAESFGEGLFDHPHYTRPADWQPLHGGQKRVPSPLLSGDHAAVAAWRRRQSLLRTLIRRPELLERVAWSRQERRVIQELALDLEVMLQDG
ncbi:MAG: tRNA (guanosine(37)-N1)-methyltransferase TrmD [Magnetococcales bacterium]|nr:tRNA (guanosine(37)-N1)-methyltransferase TrmD [Magnetococcales bacterium]MBF0440057.1 tRNA (guanosine(37)-N1)-methyltransferase TrmD [Magnetococcales bacterium]